MTIGVWGVGSVSMCAVRSMIGSRYECIEPDRNIPGAGSKKSVTGFRIEIDGECWERGKKVKWNLVHRPSNQENGTCGRNVLDLVFTFTYYTQALPKVCALERCE